MTILDRAKIRYAFSMIKQYCDVLKIEVEISGLMQKYD